VPLLMDSQNQVYTSAEQQSYLSPVHYLLVTTKSKVNILCAYIK